MSSSWDEKYPSFSLCSVTGASARAVLELGEFSSPHRNAAWTDDQSVEKRLPLLDGLVTNVCANEPMVTFRRVKWRGKE